MTDFTEFITGKNNTAILVGLNLGDSDKESLEELRQLAMSDQLVVVAIVEGRRSRPDPATYVGGGKIDEIYQLLNQTNASLVIFNHDLSPIQQRNLTERLQCQVIDRASLILDIFAQRAKSREGRLQVELAQLEYLASRLVRGWTHLERQKGGIGLRGPGETQLETDRRLLAKRVKYLREKLRELQRQRKVQRKSRQRTKVMSISIVGYTNAGKSTLFNSLTRAQAYAADQLFATLDTTTRRLFIPNNGHLVISDTVGFIRGLPHTLVAAFRATLEETAQADMLLHIVDAASSSRNEQIAEVNKLLKEIGAETIPQILVLNKIDLAESSRTANYVRDEYGRITCIRLSAKTGEGLEFIRLALAEAIAQNSVDLRENFLEVGRVSDNSATAFLEREEGLNYHGIK